MFSRLRPLTRGPATFAVVVTFLAAVVYVYASRPMTLERFNTLNVPTKIEVIYNYQFLNIAQMQDPSPLLQIISSGLQDSDLRVRQAAVDTTVGLFAFMRMRADRNRPLQITAEQGLELERIIFNGLQNSEGEMYEGYLQITSSLLMPGDMFESLLLDQMKSTSSPETKAQIWFTLMNSWSEDNAFVEDVALTLEEPGVDHTGRSMAIAIAQGTGEERFLRPLIRIVDDTTEPPYIRLRAMRALLSYGEMAEQALPVLEDQQASILWNDIEKVTIAEYISLIEEKELDSTSVTFMRSFFRKKDGPPLWTSQAELQGATAAQ